MLTRLKPTKLYLDLSIIFTVIFLPSFLFAQNSTSASDKFQEICQVKFNIELRLGDKHPQVLELQKFLNSDERTVIAATGPGSPGQETNVFGQATMTAFLKLQKLFLNLGKDKSLTKTTGSLDFKTRQILNEYCDNYKLGKTKGTNTKTINLNLSRQFIEKIHLEQNVHSATNKFIKIKLSTNENIQRPEKNSIVCDGCNVLSIRKLDNNNYLILIEKNGTQPWEVFVEADKIKNQFGNLNQEASNILKEMGISEGVTQDLQ